MPSADIYGAKSDDLEHVKFAIESKLHIQFEPHHSSYHGGDYYRNGDGSSEHFILQRNIDLIDNEPAESDFVDFPVILYVEETERSSEIRELLEASESPLSLLKHEDF
jgi:hypothetical protein